MTQIAPIYTDEQQKKVGFQGVKKLEADQSLMQAQKEAIIPVKLAEVKKLHTEHLGSEVMLLVRGMDFDFEKTLKSPNLDVKSLIIPNMYAALKTLEEKQGIV